MDHEMQDEAAAFESSRHQQQQRPAGENNSPVVSHHQQHHLIRHQPQQQQPQPQHVHVWPPVRSDPIMIARPNEEGTNIEGRRMEVDDDNSSSSGSDNNEPSSQQQQNDGSRNSSNNFTNSLPSRLLRAPLLGSLPAGYGNALDRDMPDTALPPPMAIPGQQQQPNDTFSQSQQPQRRASHAYGSLRDSHLRGRFFDGPMSYRDGRTGDIHRIQQQRVRFQGGGSGEISMSFTGGLSIGERMMQHSRQKKASTSGAAGAAASKTSSDATSTTTTGDSSDQPQQDQQQTGGASTLSRLMDSCEDQKMEANTTSTTRIQPQSSDDMDQRDDDGAAEEEDAFGAIPSHALSTSLTGLELLQRGISPYQQPFAQQQHQHANAYAPHLIPSNNNRDGVFDLEELPVDTNGRNIALSRSLSDPTPRWRHRVASSSSGNTTSSSSVQISPLLIPANPPINNNHYHDNATQAASMAIEGQLQQPVSSLLPPLNSRNNNNNPSNTSRLPPLLPPGSLQGAAASQQQQQHIQPLGSLAMSLASSPSTAFQQQDATATQAGQDTANNDDNPDTEEAFQLDF